MSDQIKFKRVLFGISKKPVVDYIENVSKSIEDKLFLKDSEIAKLKKQVEELTNKAEELNKQVLEFEEDKKQISSVFIKAEESAKAIINKAEEEAEKIINEANEKAKKTLTDMEIEREQRLKEVDAEINAQKVLLNNCKTETNYLIDKIKKTLEKFDELLEESVK